MYYMGTGEVFTALGGEQYQQFSESGGYRVSILGITEALVPFLRGLSNRPLIVEVGGGQGRSARALKEALELNGITNARFIITEKDRKLLLGASPTDTRLQNLAEALPLRDGLADALFGSQVIHWLLTPEDVARSFAEAKRVLKPGGMLVHATSGITKLGEEMNTHHFTQSPFVRVFLAAMEGQLMKHGYWDPMVDGEFEPTNRRVNPRYFNFSLDDYRDLLEKQGFRDIDITTYMFPCDTKEITARLTGLAPLQMHFFQSDGLRDIPDEEKVVVAKAAFEEASREAPDLFAYFDTQPLDVTVVGAAPGTFGEPVPVIVARK